MNIGIIQPDIISDEVEKNLQHCGELIRSLENGNGSIQILFLPEMFATGFPASKEQAEPPLTDENGNENPQAKIQQWMKHIAGELNVVVVGTLAVKEAGIYNRLVWMRPTGEYFTYDKKHLFGAEKEIYKEGGQIVTVQEQGWNFRLNICYDLRFPVWCKNRRLYNDTLDYDVAVFPSSWPRPRIDVWKTLIPARAVENLAYSIGINRSGKDISGTRYNGQSTVCDSLGNIVMQLDEKPQASVITLNKNHLEKLRRQTTVSHDWDMFEIKN